MTSSFLKASNLPCEGFIFHFLHFFTYNLCGLGSSMEALMVGGAHFGPGLYDQNGLSLTVECKLPKSACKYPLK